MRHLKLTSLLVPLALLLAACDGTKETTPTPTPGDPCADKIAECRVTQKACVSDASGAHCEACPPGKYAAASGSCEAIEGKAYSHDFTDFTVKPGEEVLGQCQSWTINNPEEIWFNAVELVQDEASHHSNWMFVPDDKFDGPDGVWKCSDRSYSGRSGPRSRRAWPRVLVRRHG